MNFLQGMYETRIDDYIDPMYNPPTLDWESWRSWVEVASFKGRGDGQDIKVYESRMPARFYRLQALDTPNSVGEVNKGFSLSTGSGREAGKLIFAMARAISEGMLGLFEVNE